ncbi:MAG: hypothetical protein WB290_01915 [Smithella sp.]
MTKKIENRVCNALKTVTDIKEAFDICDTFGLSITDMNRIVKSWQMANQILQRV